MKYLVLLISITLVGVSPLLGQTLPAASPNVPAGWIDGSKTPNLVPDRAAYRLIFLGLMLPTSASQTQVARQQVRIGQIGLSDVDAASLKQALVTFAADYSAWKQTPGATSAQGWAIVQATRSSLQSQLTSDGNSKLSAFVALAKLHMVVNPN